MATTVNIPYQPGMVLGRTFDLKNMSSGIDIFPEEAVGNVQMTRRDHNTMKYSVIKSSQDVNKVLGISGDISLKAKAGLINVNGIGSYFSEDIYNQNTVKILARAHVETVTETMKSSKPNDDWNKPVIGSHYIRSITYGGDLIVSIEIGGSNSKQKEDIKAELEAELSLMAGSVRSKASKEKLDEGKKNRAQVKIEYFSTTPRGVMPRDVDGMLKALDSFKEEVTKVNEGRGVPFSCELLPLGILDPEIPMVQQRSNETQLQQLEDYYDDIRSALTKLDTFTKREEVELTEEEDQEVREITERMEKVMDVFNEVISSLDVTSEGKQVKPALEEYKKAKKTGGFFKEVSILMKSLTPTKETSMSLVQRETVISPGIPLHMILVGKSAQGKTSTGNTIFRSRKFTSETAKPTDVPECYRVSEKIGDRCVTVVDIQGSKETKNQNQIFPQFVKLLLQNEDGFHAFLFVMSVDETLTDDDVKQFSELKKHFGDILTKHSIIVFTGGDKFENKMKQEGNDTSFEQYIQEQGGPLIDLIQDFGGRYILINNMETDESVNCEQVAKLISIVSKMVEQNHYARYTNQFFKISAVVNFKPHLFFVPDQVPLLWFPSKRDPKEMALTQILRQEMRHSDLQTFLHIFFPQLKETSEQCVIS